MFNFTACFIKILGRNSVGGYEVDSQNMEMVENG